MQNNQNDIFQAAVKSYRANDFPQVETICNDLLHENPGHEHCLNLLGLVAQVKLQHKTAIQYFKLASQNNSAEPSYYQNIAMSYHATNQTVLAIEALETVLKLNKQDTTATLLNLAMLCQQQPDKAITYLERLLQIEPHNAGVVNQLVGHLLAVGNRDRALSIALQSVEIINSDDILYYNLALLLHNQDPQQAIKAYQKSIRFNPGRVSAYTNLGSLYLQKKLCSKAIVHYKKAVDLEPENKNNWRNLCIAYQQDEKNMAALLAIRRALQINPDDEDCLNILSQCLLQRSALSGPYDESLLNDYLACLNAENKVVSNLLRFGENVLNDTLSSILDINQETDSSWVESLENKCTKKEFQWQQLNTPIVIETLKNLPLRGLRIERLLTAIRRVVANVLVAPGNDLGDSPIVFLAALAEQCFYNEYIYYQSPVEEKIILSLELSIKENIEQEAQPEASKLALLACYKPLYFVSNSQRLIHGEFFKDHSDFHSLLTKQIIEPLKEEEIKPMITRLFVVEDDTSKKVQQQYEYNSYPRWDNYIKAPVTNLQSFISQEMPWLEPLPIENNRPEILVAGCGTGKETIGMAKRFPEARITAVDLSQSSLAYAIRKAQELNLTNISWAQTDLLQLSEWPRRFDMINSAGVLHHMKNPLKGWQVITRLLKPGGVMNIGLYSKIARYSIIAARQFIKENAYPSTPEGIRQCRQDLIALDKDHPARQCIQYGDFFTLSDCRDLLFHVQEHCYTIPEIKKSLQILGLKFIKFHVSTKIKENFLEDYPNQLEKQDESLNLWHQFEINNPQTFLTMYQFWLHKAL